MLRKIFPKTVFVSTNLPDKRLRVAKNQQELDELEDDSADIYKSNIIERYSIGPSYIQSVNNMCLAEFAAYLLPWRHETELLGNEQTYMSKFYEPNVQTVVEDNKNIFEPDSDAVIEALETLRNKDMSTMHSYDDIYDQENEDLLSHTI